MTYQRRIAWSALAALALHILLLAWLGWAAARERAIVPGRMAREEPLVLNLEPPQPPRRLVDTQVASEEPIDPSTDLISDKNAKASDLSDVQGERPAPHMDKESAFDELGGVAAPPAPSTPTEQPSVPTEPEQQPAPKNPRPAPPAKEKPKPPEPPEKKHQEPFEVARADSPPPDPATQLAPAPTERPAIPEGRPDGGVTSKGFVGFEAYRDELAPYLKDIRRRVEGQWKAALQLRYSGTEPTEAVLDCAISPDGRLVSAEIIDPGGSPTYASLCKLAMERAAPFGPFPFKVPEIYRSRNLEIRWTFSFFK